MQCDLLVMSSVLTIRQATFLCQARSRVISSLLWFDPNSFHYKTSLNKRKCSYFAFILAAEVDVTVSAVVGWLASKEWEHWHTAWQRNKSNEQLGRIPDIYFYFLTINESMLYLLANVWLSIVFFGNCVISRINTSVLYITSEKCTPPRDSASAPLRGPLFPR
jgi:hypothetical protein